MYSSLSMYNSAVTPSISHHHTNSITNPTNNNNNYNSNQNSTVTNYSNSNVSSGSSTLKLFPSMKPVRGQSENVGEVMKLEDEGEEMGQYFEGPGTPTSAIKSKQFVESTGEMVERWRVKKQYYKSKIFQLSTELVVKNSLLLQFQQLTPSQPSQSTSLIKSLTLQLTTSQSQSLSLSSQLSLTTQTFTHQLSLRQSQLKHLKQQLLQLQKSKQLPDLYSSNVPKMNKDKEFYVFKLIECQNTLRQRDMTIGELQKIQKIIIKEMDQMKSKKEGEKGIGVEDVKKYLEREQQLIKSITRIKVEGHNREMEMKRVRVGLESEIQVLKKENVQIKELFQRNVKEYQLQNIQLKQRIKQHQTTIKNLSQQLRSLEQVSHQQNQQSINLLQSKLVTVLKQLQIANSQYQHYKLSLHQELQSLKSINYKLTIEIKVFKENKDSKQKIYETLLKEFDKLKKGSIEVERTLREGNSVAVRRCTELEGEINRLKFTILQKQKQLFQLSFTNSPSKLLPTTDIDVATLRSQNHTLTQKLKSLQHKLTEHDFNNKLIQNLETENKYIKETVRIQTAEIAFLKKQHLEVIESMINLNQRKVSGVEDGIGRKWEELVGVMDKYQKIFKDGKTIKGVQILSLLNQKIFDSKYTFIQSLSLQPITLSPTKLLPQPSSPHPLQHSQSYHQDPTITIFYQQNFKSLLLLFDIDQDSSNPQTQLNQKIKQLINNNLKLSQEVRVKRERVEVLEMSVRGTEGEGVKKDRMIEELGKQLIKLEGNVGVAVDKLIKYQGVIEEGNRRIVEYQLERLSGRCGEWEIEE